MKKTNRRIVFAVAVGMVLFSAPAMAQQQAEAIAPAPEAKMEKKWDIARGFKYGAALKMVATEDGGVVVLIGNQLLKYDKDLNLIKKVTVDVDPAAICPWKGRKGSGADMKGSGPMMGEPGGM